MLKLCQAVSEVQIGAAATGKAPLPIIDKIPLINVEVLFLVAHKTCQLLHTVHCFGIHIWPNSENDCSVHLHSPVSTRCARAPKCADILECDFTRACFAVTDVSSSLSYLRHLSCTLSLASNCITSACFVQCVIFGFTVHVCCIFSTILSKLQAAEPRYR